MCQRFAGHPVSARAGCVGYGKISVGPPYFNSVFIPLTAPLLRLIGIGTLSRWKRDTFENLWPKLRLPLLASAIFGVLFPLVAMDYFDGMAALECSWLPGLFWSAPRGISKSLRTWIVW